MTKQEFLSYLQNEDFTQLFVECGWSKPTTKASFTIGLGEKVFAFREVAQKGVRIFTSEVETFPPTSTRRLLDAKLRRQSHDYLLVFTLSNAPMHHMWMVPVKAVDKRQIVTIEYDKPSQAEFLFEKVRNISFGLDEDPTIMDVVARVNTQFLVNASDVTKKFYQGFRKQHEAFVKKLEGIPDATHRNWYASVMLNRLMFCYFIQKKRFLDENENYLQDKLAEVIRQKGEDKFFGTFYRGFLKGLFQEGLNSPKRSASFIRTYGNIPYLNGGMFELHQLERQYNEIDVPDKVFKDLFSFFDEWRWHLDSRITESGRDINPDVLGYIFEQYINDRAQMGAYYTKEDITEYIGRNCILPYLFEAVKKADPKPFKPTGEVWRTLQSSGDKYIFDAMKKGLSLSLPAEIEKGVDTSKPKLRERRTSWNKPADAVYALPTEIWRETVARRQRCAEVLSTIQDGNITDIYDFITYNLDIRAFAEDLIRDTDDHLFVRHFYDAVRSVTILDPTCGSGAFLFAGLNILEPLYEACLDRMEEPAFAKYFRDELNEIKDKYRSNRQYFIYKNIILRNLYGVDIMHEATEIARLRLFLKMVAVVEADPMAENMGLDPLPDVDFNIRCGNTLVGYASPDHLKKALNPVDALALYGDEYEKVKVKASDVAVICNRFRMEQLSGNSSFYYRKADLRKALDELRDMLDETLAKTEYGINLTTSSGPAKFKKWREDTQPFHWYSEFYDIIVGHGGFDVIIGNPPYVESKDVKEYSVRGFETLPCGDLYAFTMERSGNILEPHGFLGMIVPISVYGVDGFKTLQSYLDNRLNKIYVSSYSNRPSQLFEGAQKRLSIVLSQGGDKLACEHYTTSYYRWKKEEFSVLFSSKIHYVRNDIPYELFAGSLGKLGSCLELSIFKKLIKPRRTVASLLSDGRYDVYYTRKFNYFLSFLDEVPIVKNVKTGEVIPPSELKALTVPNRDWLYEIIAGLTSSTFFWFWNVLSDCRNLNRRDLLAFAIPGDEGPTLVTTAQNYLKALKKTRYFMKKSGLELETFGYSSTKNIIDGIDVILGRGYGLSGEELDHIINYDIKYRMGDELGAE